MKHTGIVVMGGVSIFYMVVAILLFLGSNAWSLFRTGSLKELGAPLFTAEFFTVLFAPLTFLWVLYGYFQQSKELAHRSRPHLTLRKRCPEGDWHWIVE